VTPDDGFPTDDEILTAIVKKAIMSVQRFRHKHLHGDLVDIIQLAQALQCAGVMIMVARADDAPRKDEPHGTLVN
jgi:hypothetical protein